MDDKLNDLMLYDDCVTSVTGIVYLENNTEEFLHDFNWDDINTTDGIRTIKLSSIFKQVNDKYKNIKSISICEDCGLRGKEYIFDVDIGEWSYVGTTMGWA